MEEKEKKKVFVIFLDDDDTIKKLWIDNISEFNNHVEFEYHGETYIIPMYRVLKIKKRLRK